ncbi:MAG: hypothetical protein E7663_07665 [Ruminococcaceae bacterium]|nr:hypothetical protein [Oscillospiraceae bacterium]
MRLIEVYAEEFGCLLDRRFSFWGGINLIEGKNESGKSTLLALLRFLFYGFPKKGAADREERDRRLSWRGRVAAGSLLLEWQGEYYTVARRYAIRGTLGHESGAEVLKVVYAESGKDVALEGKTPGEFFMGLPAELYDSSLCVRQSDLARVSEGGTGEAVGELLFSGDGANAERAERILQNLRRDLQHQRGRGGRIAELEDRIAATDAALTKAKEGAAELLQIRGDIARYGGQIAEKNRELEAVNAALVRLDAEKKLAAYEEWHRARAAEATALAEYDRTKAEQAGRISPDGAFFDRINGALREHARASDARERLRAEMLTLREEQFSEDLLAACEVVDAQGGAESLYRHAEEAQGKRRSLRRAALICLISALLLSIGFLLSPLLLIGTGVLLLLSLLFLLRSGSHNNSLRGILAALGAETLPELKELLEQCRTERERHAAHGEQRKATERAYADADAHCRALFEGICYEFSALGARELPTTPEAAARMLDELYRMSGEAQHELARVNTQYERAKGIREALGAQLDPNAEAALRAACAAAPATTESETHLQGKRRFLVESIEGLVRKRAESERAESALVATVRDPSLLRAERGMLANELEQARARADAVNLAIAALSEAREDLRSSVTPRVAAVASPLFSELVGGAYRGLLIGDDFSVTLETATGPHPLSGFSAGCRDAAHLALRVGLLETVTRERVPLLMDEAMARLDDDRALAFLKTLQRYAAQGQCLLFTCHGRERRMLSEIEAAYHHMVV